MFFNDSNLGVYFLYYRCVFENEKNQKNMKKHEKSKKLTLFLKVFHVFKKINLCFSVPLFIEDSLLLK